MKFVSMVRDALRFALYRCQYDFDNAAAPKYFDINSMRRIVICKIDGKLGDTEVISPFFRALKAVCPQVKLTVLTSAVLAPLYRDFLGADEVYVTPKRPDKAFLNDLSAKIGCCDLLITLEAVFRFHDFYLLSMLRPPLIAGVNGQVSSINLRLNELVPDGHITDYFSYLLLRGGIKSFERDYVSFKDPASMAKAHAFCCPGQIMFAPWGASVHKHLSDQAVVETAKLILTLTAAPLCLMVPPDGVYLRKLLKEALPEALAVRMVDVPPQLNISELAAVCAFSAAAVSVDTAIVHLVCAENRPLFALYNGNHPELTRLWAPLPGKQDAAVFSLNSKMIDELKSADFAEPLKRFLAALQVQNSTGAPHVA